MRHLTKKELVEEITRVGLESGLSEEEVGQEATSVQAIHLTSTGEILVPKGASTSLRLHEVGHKVLGHTDRYSDAEEGFQTIGDEILDEILAEKYSYDMRGKESTYRLAVPAINMLIWKYKWAPEATVHWSLRILEKELGITATKKERRELARHAAGYCRRPRRG